MTNSKKIQNTKRKHLYCILVIRILVFGYYLFFVPKASLREKLFFGIVATKYQDVKYKILMVHSSTLNKLQSTVKVS